MFIGWTGTDRDTALIMVGQCIAQNKSDAILYYRNFIEDGKVTAKMYTVYDEIAPVELGMTEVPGYEGQGYFCYTGIVKRFSAEKYL